jgi:hypothetical protein
MSTARTRISSAFLALLVALGTNGCDHESGNHEGEKANLTPADLEATLLRWEEGAPQDVQTEIRELRSNNGASRIPAAIRLRHLERERKGRTRGAIRALVETLYDTSEYARVPEGMNPYCRWPIKTPPGTLQVEEVNPGFPRTCPASEAGEALGAIGIPAVQPLIRALKDTKCPGRSYAAEALGLIKDTRAVEPLIEALKDTEERVRRGAAKGLGCFGDDPRAIEPLIRALRDNDVGVRAGAADALGAMKDERAFRTLVEALKDGKGGLRCIAARALGRPRNARAVGPLIEALESGEEQLRSDAARSLGSTWDARAVDPLIKALKAGPTSVRTAAAEALGMVGDPRAVPALLAVIKEGDSGDGSYEDRLLWDAAKRAVESIRLRERLRKQWGE